MSGLLSVSQEITKVQGSLFQNHNGFSEYNDILAQHATWHYKLNAKKLELLKRSWQVGDFSKFIKGKHGFIMGENWKNKKIPFLARKVYQYWSRVNQKMHNSNIFVGMFPNKSWFCQ